MVSSSFSLSHIALSGVYHIRDRHFARRGMFRSSRGPSVEFERCHQNHKRWCGVVSPVTKTESDVMSDESHHINDRYPTLR